MERRVKSFMVVLPLAFRLLSVWSLSVQSFSRSLVEQVDQRRIRLEAGLVAGFEFMPFAEPRHDLLAPELGEYLRLRTGWFDHDDLGVGAVVRDREMLRPDAVD